MLEPFRDQLPPEVFTEPAFTPPVQSAGQQTDRTAIREASRLLDEAGWEVGADGMRRNAAGEAADASRSSTTAPRSSAIVLPFIANLRRIGIDARFERVDSAQMEERQENFDFDIIDRPHRAAAQPLGRAALGLRLGRQRRPRHAEPRRHRRPGGRRADRPDHRRRATASEMEVRVRALDRVLRSMHVWVPNWYKGPTSSPTGTSSAGPTPNPPTTAATSSGGGTRRNTRPSRPRARCADPPVVRFEPDLPRSARLAFAASQLRGWPGAAMRTSACSPQAHTAVHSLHEIRLWGLRA